MKHATVSTDTTACDYDARSVALAAGRYEVIEPDGGKGPVFLAIPGGAPVWVNPHDPNIVIEEN